VIDPRIFQIAALSGLLVWGVVGLGFDIRPGQAAVLIASALLTQWLASRATRQAFDPRSPLISSLSLCLLLRTDALWIAGAVACATIASKFLVRSRGKHVFNPTTFGLAAALLLSDRVWISAGQWGTSAWAAFAMACMGMLVVRRAERSDVTWAFLAGYLALVYGRSLWLGDPIARRSALTLGPTKTVKTNPQILPPS
jgi:Na+-transporting NADH:ubiquinone oxidoreductase subunit NqrB